MEEVDLGGSPVTFQDNCQEHTDRLQPGWKGGVAESFRLLQDEFLCFEWNGKMKRSSQRLASQRASSVPSDRIENQMND